VAQHVNASEFARRCVRLALMGLNLGLMVLLGGCRLYEPPRYSRLQLANDSPRTRVLFVGNSMTYYNDLPGLVQQLSAREDKPVQFESVTVPLASLEYHWSRGKAQELMARERWDYVVLQDFSRRPVTDPQSSLQYFGLFNAEARKAGAKTIIFQNWTRAGMIGEYGAMQSTYRDIQEQTHGTLAPIGVAWRMCERDHPEIKMLVDDRHPTDAGTYLTGCVLYGTIYGKNPAALPMNLTGPKLPAEQSRLLREIASQALREASATTATK
jgi:hypothetical protein